MMIAPLMTALPSLLPLPLLLLAQAAAPSIDGLPIAPLPRQELPARGCAAYLFSTGQTRVLAAMASADPARLRLSLEGRMTDLPRVDPGSPAAFGLADRASYRIAGLTATLEMTIEPRAQLNDGAAVPSAVLRLDRDGRDTVAIPLAGLIGCRT